jgi:hypothetical protein
LNSLRAAYPVNKLPLISLKSPLGLLSPARLTPYAAAVAAELVLAHAGGKQEAAVACTALGQI